MERRTARKREQNAITGQTEEATIYRKLDESTENIIGYEASSWGKSLRPSPANWKP